MSVSSTDGHPSMSLCPVDRRARLAHGVPPGRKGWTTHNLATLLFCVRHPRGRLTPAQRKQAAQLSARLRPIAEGGPASAKLTDEPMVPCAWCASPLGEFELMPGGVAFIGAPLARDLIVLIDPHRGRLTPEQIQRSEVACRGLARAMKLMLDRASAGRADCNPMVGDG